MWGALAATTPQRKHTHSMHHTSVLWWWRRGRTKSKIYYCIISFFFFNDCNRVVRGQLAHQDRYSNWWPFSSAFVRNPTQINLNVFVFMLTVSMLLFFSKLTSYLLTQTSVQQIHTKHNANDCSSIDTGQYCQQSIRLAVCINEVAVGSTIICISVVGRVLVCGSLLLQCAIQFDLE